MVALPMPLKAPEAIDTMPSDSSELRKNKCGDFKHPPAHRYCSAVKTVKLLAPKSVIGLLSRTLRAREMEHG